MENSGPMDPTDVLEAIKLQENISSQLYTLRRGLRLMMHSWPSSSAGLSTAAHAASSLAALTTECLALLSYMEANETYATPGQEKKPKAHSTNGWTYTIPARSDNSGATFQSGCLCDTCRYLTRLSTTTPKNTGE